MANAFLSTADTSAAGAFFLALRSRAVILDNAGVIVAVNKEWQLHARRAGAVYGSMEAGADYLAICRRAAVNGHEAAGQALAGLESVLHGSAPVFRLDYSCETAEGLLWFQMLALPLAGEGAGVVVIHLDITDQKKEQEARQESEKRFHGLVESSNLAYVMLDPQGAVLDINNSYLALTGRSARDEVVGRDVLEWTAPAGRRRLQDAIIRCVSTGRAQRVEIEYNRGQGDALVVGMNLMMMTALGSPRLLAFCFDLTEQKRTAEALQERNKSDDRYRDVVESQTELVCRYLPDTTLTFVNEAYCRFFKLTRGELIGRQILDFLPLSTHENILAAIRRAISNGRPLIVEHEVIAPEGEIHWQEWVDIPIFDSEGKLIELQGIGRDITSQHRAEEELKASHRQVSDLASRLMSAQEVERRTIARELHDDLSQRLAAHAIALSNLRRRMPALPDALEQRMAVLEAEAMALGDSVRQLSHQLHPAVLEQLGLAAALRSFCAETAERSQLIFHVDAKNPDHAVADQVALTLYRVAQETIRNIERHARAKNVWVRLSFEALNASMEIRDDGVGFDTEGSDKSTGLGLISVEERIRFLNGRLTLESRPGAGTSVHVYIPQPQDPCEAPAHTAR